MRLNLEHLAHYYYSSAPDVEIKQSFWIRILLSSNQTKYYRYQKCQHFNFSWLLCSFSNSQDSCDFPINPFMTEADII